MTSIYFSFPMAFNILAFFIQFLSSAELLLPSVYYYYTDNIIQRLVLIDIFIIIYSWWRKYQV